MTAEMETMAESLDTLHVEVLDGRGLLAGAVSYSVALSVGFYTKGTPYVPAVSGGASWRHRLQVISCCLCRCHLLLWYSLQVHLPRLQCIELCGCLRCR